MHFHIIPKTDEGHGLGTQGKFWKSKPIDKTEAPLLAAKIAALISGPTSSEDSASKEADSGKEEETEATATTEVDAPASM